MTSCNIKLYKWNKKRQVTVDCDCLKETRCLKVFKGEPSIRHINRQEDVKYSKAHDNQFNHISNIFVYIKTTYTVGKI